MDLEVSALVSRSDLDPPLSDLDINDYDSYILGRGFNIASLTWDKTTVESPFVHGRVVTRETMEVVESEVGVYVLGSSHAQLEANIATLLEAFTQQYSYQLKVNVEGTQHTWLCERADYQIGYVTEYLLAFKVPVKFTLARSPVPLAGSF